MRKLIKSLLFNYNGINRIRFGVSRGMMTKYDPDNRSQHLLGLYEREIYNFLKSAIDKASALIDIGANDGYYALAFLKFPNKKITLCEPGESKSDLLANLSLNGFTNEKHFKLVEDFVGRSVSPGYVSLNELIHSGQSTFILIDVDGGELEIVEGFHHRPEDKVEWLIETHSLELEQGVIRCLTENGYRCEIISSAWWRFFLPEQRPLPHNRWLFASRSGS